MIKKLLLIIVIASLVGCATPYQQRKWYRLSGGYSDSKIDKNKFLVTFVGNGYTNMQKASDYSLLRSGEIAKENNFTYFKVDNSEEEIVRSTTYSCSQYICTPIYVSNPVVTKSITCFDGKLKIDEKNKDKIFIAQNVIDIMKEKYQIKGK